MRQHSRSLPLSCSGSAKPPVKGGGRERERGTGHRDLAGMSVDDFFESGLVSSSDDDSDSGPTASAHKKHSRVKKRLIIISVNACIEASSHSTM